MTEGDLFDMDSLSSGSKPEEKTECGEPRIRWAQRHQKEFISATLDEMLPEEHQVRGIWSFVEHLDLRSEYMLIQSVTGYSGRPAIDPKILLALWIYATIDGVGSARRLERLCMENVAYRWLCGGVSVNYHTLSDFRSQRETLMDRLLVENVAVMMNEGLVEMNRVAQDGMRVRASAGSASFRREQSLQECLKAAEEQVEALRKEQDDDPGAGVRRLEARRESAAHERMERVKKALEQLPDVRSRKRRSDRSEARVSTTDPDARVMKMADGGFRPAFNVQFAVDTQTQVIVGVDVDNNGSDMGKLKPMAEKLLERYGRLPREILADGNFAKKTDICELAGMGEGCIVYTPVQSARVEHVDSHKPRDRDPPEVAEWRIRMNTPEAKEIYRERASTVECVNAITRNRGLLRFLVRGVTKVNAVAKLHALTHNVMRMITLRMRAATA